MKKSALRILISLGFIGLLVYLMRDDVPNVVAALRGANRTLIAGSTLVFLAAILILARRLQLIFEVEDIRIKLRECASLTFVGYFFNNFLPTAVGGDIVKAMCAARVTGEAMKSATTVLMDRIFGLFTFIAIPSVTLLFYMKQIQNPAVPLIVYSLLAVSLGCFVLLFNRGLARRFRFIETLLNKLRLGEKMRRVYDELNNFKNHRGVVAQAMLLSLVGQSVSIFVLYGMAVALGAKADVVYFFLLVPVVNLVSMLPSLNGLGIREGAYIYFLAPYIGKGNAAALGILWLGLLLMLSVIGGILYLLRADYHIRFKAATS